MPDCDQAILADRRVTHGGESDGAVNHYMRELVTFPVVGRRVSLERYLLGRRLADEVVSRSPTKTNPKRPKPNTYVMVINPVRTTPNPERQALTDDPQYHELEVAGYHLRALVEDDENQVVYFSFDLPESTDIQVIQRTLKDYFSSRPRGITLFSNAWTVGDHFRKVGIPQQRLHLAQVTSAEPLSIADLQELEVLVDHQEFCLNLTEPEMRGGQHRRSVVIEEGDNLYKKIAAAMEEEVLVVGVHSFHHEKGQPLQPQPESPGFGPDRTLFCRKMET